MFLRHTPEIPVLGGPEAGDYVVSLRPVWAIKQNPNSKLNKQVRMSWPSVCVIGHEGA